MNTDGHSKTRDNEYMFIFHIFYHCRNELMHTFYFPSPGKVISKFKRADNQCIVFHVPMDPSTLIKVPMLVYLVTRTL